MGSPALQLAPAEELIANEAAQQTTRFIVYEGGKSAAATAGELAATVGESSLTAGAATFGESVTLGELASGVLGSIGAGLLVLLWPSQIGPEPELPPITAGPTPGPSPTAPPVPRQASDLIQKCPESQKCPPHDWYEANPGKSAEAGMNERQEQIKELAKSPSQASVMRGYQFERDAIDLNGRLRPIQSTGRLYRCRRCPAQQEVDIVFEDGQIAEAKSRTYKGVKNGGDQAKRYADLQSWLNKTTGRNHKPLGKLDKSRPDISQSAAKFEERGFEVELLDTNGI